MTLADLAKMEPKSKQEAYSLLVDFMLELSERKNNDYSPENISLYGELGVAVRVGDKALRLKSLVVDRKVQQVSDESVNDTWLDLSNYGFIALLLRFGWWNLPWRPQDD